MHIRTRVLLQDQICHLSIVADNTLTLQPSTMREQVCIIEINPCRLKK